MTGLVQLTMWKSGPRINFLKSSSTGVLAHSKSLWAPLTVDLETNVNGYTCRRNTPGMLSYGGNSSNKLSNMVSPPHGDIQTVSA